MAKDIQWVQEKNPKKQTNKNTKAKTYYGSERAIYRKT